MEKRKAYEEKLAAQLDEWRALVAVFQAKADKATAQAKIEQCEIADSLWHKHDEARLQLASLRGAGNDAWEELKRGTENAWTDLRAAFLSAASRFGN